jgi:hypothetical protein
MSGRSEIEPFLTAHFRHVENVPPRLFANRRRDASFLHQPRSLFLDLAALSGA